MSQESCTRSYVTRTDVWALGITTVIGGQYFIWNTGLEAGLGSYCIATLLVGCAYCCLCLCASEISSTLPFAGGAYGLARCTLGYYPGYMIGCFESLQYIIYVSTSVTFLSSMIVSETSLFQPLVWVCLYGSTLAIHIKGGSLLWRFNLVIAILSILLLIVYCGGSLAFVDIAENLTLNMDPLNPYFNAGIFMFIRHIPTASSFFLGVQSLNLASDEVANPKTDIPYGQMSAMMTLFATAILVLFITVSLPQNNEISSQNVPLNTGNLNY